MRADEYDRAARARFWAEQDGHVDAARELLERVVKVLAIDAADQHYVIDKVWRAWTALTITLAIAGVDQRELVRQLHEATEHGGFVHQDLACELADF